jgi:hypothetical protein
VTREQTLKLGLSGSEKRGEPEPKSPSALPWDFELDRVLPITDEREGIGRPAKANYLSDEMARAARQHNLSRSESYLVASPFL